MICNIIFIDYLVLRGFHKSNLFIERSETLEKLGAERPGVLVILNSVLIGHDDDRNIKN